MISKIKSLLTGAILVVALSMPFAVPVVANASTNTGYLCSGASGDITGSPSSCGTAAGTTVNNTIKLVLNLFSAIVGIIAVIMIIIGGVKYITSGGSSEKTSSAKDTILFAIVGLIVVALAQVIVQFVLNKASGL
ncbi:MAG TPA: hypothetical protein VII94_00470 [Candidatus Saccharimonadales bacterium]